MGEQRKAKGGERGERERKMWLCRHNARNQNGHGGKIEYASHAQPFRVSVLVAKFFMSQALTSIGL